MTVIICILAYLIPLIIGCYCVYKDMNPGETVDHYIYRRNLEDVFWIMFIPGINILGLVVVMIVWAMYRISQFRKPYDSENTKN
jgi:heme/copper-type cytochrome/quinol oxidase subunit 2